MTKRLQLLVLTILFATVGFAYSGYVGDYVDLKVSVAASDIYSIDWKKWSGATDNVTLTVNWGNDATVHIDSYFTGSVRIRAQYKTMSNAIKTEYFDITCNAVTLYPQPSSMSLKVDEKDYITYTSSPSGKWPTVSYSSSNTNVATVGYSSGQVTAMAKGYATITLSNSMGPDVTVSVVVTGGPDDNVMVNSITIGTPSAMTVGETQTLTATVSPSNATNKTVKWSSGNTTVASIHETTGLVTAKSAGTTIITCAATDGSNVKTTCNIVVNDSPKPKLSLSANPSGGSVESGTKVYLTASANGSTVSGADIYYTTNGSTPSKSSTKYTSSGITITNATTIKAIAYKNGYEASDVESWSYTIASKPKLTLSASPSGGSVESGTKVYLSASADGSTISGADIYYTTNGTTPSKNSIKYTSSGITITQDCSLKAIAYKDGYEASDVLVENYTIPLTIDLHDVQVAAGSDYSLFLRADGSLWACGNNSRGQFGNGSEIGSKVPIKCLSGVAKIESGNEHTLILKDDGTLWACGSNLYGQLGDGTTTKRMTPILIMNDVLTMSASWSHTAIVKKDGTLWVCGDNQYGELGDGTKIDRKTPVQIMESVESVSAGVYCTFIIKKDKTLWACGRNVCGELGDGTKTEVTKPKKIMDNVKKVQACHSSAASSTFIIKTDGSLWACGANDSGRLGDGTTTDRILPVHIMDNVIDVSTGFYHTLFLKEDRTLWACGQNYYGQLGYPIYNDQLIPKKILDNVISVSAGEFHSLAAKTDGTMWSWGSNEAVWSYSLYDGGQLGDGTTNSRYTPVKILNSLDNMPKDDIFTVKLADNVYADFTVLSALSKTCELTHVSGSIVGHFAVPTKVSDYRVIGIRSLGLNLQNELTSIDIPSSIISINANPFYRCTSLESITVSKDNVVFDSRNDCNAIIRTETKELISGCRNTVIPQDVVTIGPDCFSYLKGLFSIKIPDTVSTIADYAFYRCEDLRSVQLPANLKTIGEWAFANCDLLPSITIPYTVESIGKYAFNSENLISIKCYIKKPITISEFVFDYNSYSKGTLYIPYGTKSDYEKADGWNEFKNIVEMEKEVQPIDVSISAAGYATFFDSQSAYTLPNGLSAQVVTNAANNKLNYKTIADGSVFGVVPAGTAVMLVSDSKKSGTYTLTASENSTTYSGTNLLRGSDEAQMTTGEGYHYKLSYGMSGTSWSNVFGWYWGADNGAPFMTEGHKAWLVVPKSATTTRGFTIDGETTGITTLESSGEEADFYDLQGRRVVNPTVKGIYIRNGKKVMVK